jgi:hypothetical protein
VFEGAFDISSDFEAFVASEVQRKVAEATSVADKIKWTISFWRAGDTLPVAELAEQIGVPLPAVRAVLDGADFANQNLSRYVRVVSVDGIQSIERLDT